MTTVSMNANKKTSPESGAQGKSTSKFDPTTIAELPSLEDAMNEYGEVAGVCEECLDIPDIDLKQFRDLCTSIAVTGLQHPILLTDDGELIDGRSRLRACYITGAEPHWRTISNAQNRFAITMANFTGRTLSVGQKAAFASRHMPKLEEWAKERQRKRASVLSESNPDNEAAGVAQGMEDFQTMQHFRLLSGTARDQAAALVGCSGRSVANFVRLKKFRPEWAKEVAAGKATLESKTKLLKRELDRHELPQKIKDVIRQVLAGTFPGEGKVEDKLDNTVAAESEPNKQAAPESIASDSIAPAPKSATKTGTTPKQSRDTFLKDLLWSTQMYSHRNMVVLELEWLTAPLLILQRTDGCVLTAATPDPFDEEYFDGEPKEAVLCVLQNQLRQPNKNLLNKDNDGIRVHLLGQLEKLPAKRGATAPAPKKTKGRAVKKASKPKRKSQ